MNNSYWDYLAHREQRYAGIEDQYKAKVSDYSKLKKYEEELDDLEDEIEELEDLLGSENDSKARARIASELKNKIERKVLLNSKLTDMKLKKAK